MENRKCLDVLISEAILAPVERAESGLAGYFPRGLTFQLSLCTDQNLGCVYIYRATTVTGHSCIAITPTFFLLEIQQELGKNDLLLQMVYGRVCLMFLSFYLE